MIEDLIIEISKVLHILRGESETQASWILRVLYSATGLNMLASVYDYDDNVNKADEGTVSMQHVLNHGGQLLRAYGELYGIKSDIHNIAENIRTLYIRTGYMFHRANRLTYPGSACASSEHAYITRGQDPWDITHMSGLGTFALMPGNLQEFDLYDMFCFEKQPLSKWWQSFLNGTPWQRRNDLPYDVEYINITEVATNGYWTMKTPKHGVVLFRDKRDYGKQYGLLKLSEDAVELCVLPSWQVDDGAYLRIALALRCTTGNLPTLAIKSDGGSAVIKPNYLLPPPEQNFVELFSWPTVKNIPWERVVSTELLPVLKKLYGHMGFEIQEGS